MYNGAADAIATLTGALAVFGVGYVRLNWETFGDFAILATSLIAGTILTLSGLTDMVWVAYLGMSISVARHCNACNNCRLDRVSDVVRDDDDSGFI